MSAIVTWTRRHRLVAFFGLTFLLSWWSWPFYALDLAPTAFFPCGPLVAALVVVGVAEGPAGYRDLGARMIRWRVGWIWWFVAIGTPLNLRYNADHCVEQYSQLAHYCGITADSPEERAARFVDRIVELLQSIGMPDRVEAPGELRDELAESLARNAIESTPVPLKLNPRRIGHAELVDLFRELLE